MTQVHKLARQQPDRHWAEPGAGFVLVVAGWSFTESINDGIEPTSGPRPEPSSPGPTWKCSAPTPTPSPDVKHEITDLYVDREPRAGVTAVACLTSG